MFLRTAVHEHMDIIGTAILIEIQMTTCKCKTQILKQKQKKKMKRWTVLQPFFRMFVF